MKKSWVLVEVTESAGEKNFKPLAGTEDKKCVNRALQAMKLYRDEVLKAGRDDLTLIHTTVVDDVEYNATLDEVLEPEPEDEVAKILSLVNTEESR